MLNSGSNVLQTSYCHPGSRLFLFGKHRVIWDNLVKLLKISGRRDVYDTRTLLSIETTAIRNFKRYRRRRIFRISVGKGGGEIHKLLSMRFNVSNVFFFFFFLV